MHLNARILTLAAAVAVAVTASVSAKGPAAGRLITIKAGDDMKFDVVSINARPGEGLVVKVTTTGKLPKFVMAHNFVLLKKGTDAKAFADQAMKAQATAYIPPALKTQVLAATDLAGPGETVQVAFKAPTAPGRYEFICSFPGHFAAGMKGVLVVTSASST
jgi:azurin